MIKFIKIIVKEFLGLEMNYDEFLLHNKDEVLKHLEEEKRIELENKLILEEKKSYYDYLTLKNALWVLFFLGLIGGGFWLYNSYFFDDSILLTDEVLIGLLNYLSRDLDSIDYETVLDILRRLKKDYSLDLSNEEIKTVLQARNLLRNLDDFMSLDISLSDVLEDREGVIFNDPINLDTSLSNVLENSEEVIGERTEL